MTPSQCGLAIALLNGYVVDQQGDLRDDILRLMLPWVNGGRVTSVQAAIACMSAMSVVLATFPPKTREQICEMICDRLLEHANMRATEVRSGELDRQLDGH